LGEVLVFRQGYEYRPRQCEDSEKPVRKTRSLINEKSSNKKKSKLNTDERILKDLKGFFLFLQTKLIAALFGVKILAIDYH
jgi:hypothetical protein